MAGYGDDAGLTAYLAANGLTLPGGAPSLAVIRQRGSDYVDRTYGLEFSGQPLLGIAQERAWGRAGASAFGAAITDGVIPAQVITASYIAGYADAVKPGVLAKTVTTGTKRAKAGPVEVEFADGATTADMTPVLTAVEGLLRPFLNSAAFATAVMVV